MTGIEYMNTVCPTTSKGKDPNREDVADAFEDGIAEGYKKQWKPTEEQLNALATVVDTFHPSPQLSERLINLYHELTQL